MQGEEKMSEEPEPFNFVAALSSKPSSSNQTEREINELSQRIAMEQQAIKNAAYPDLRNFLTPAVPNLDCPGCQIKFPTNEDLQKHIIMNLNIEQPSILKCSIPYNHVLKLDPDLSPMSPTKPYNCPSCPRRFKTKGEVKSHLLIHSEEKAFKCSICIAEFKRKTELRRHELVHLNLSPYKCIECTKSFRTKGELKSHFLIHSNYRQFKCSVCNLEFKRRAELNRHRTSHQSSEPPMCEECMKRLDNPVELKEHLMEFHGVRMLRCPHCSAEFTNNEEFKRHGLIHKTAVHCSLCGSEVKNAAKIFNGAIFCTNCAKLKVPIEPPPAIPQESVPGSSRIDNKEVINGDLDGIFACTECDKVFKTKPQLQSHKITHSPVKAFRCLECGAEYRRKAELQRHAMIHLHLSPFACPHCAGKFRTKGELKSHLLIHSPVRPYKCFKCHSEYKRKGELRNHQAKCLDATAPERQRSLCHDNMSSASSTDTEQPSKDDQRVPWPSPCLRFSNFPFSYGYGFA